MRYRLAKLKGGTYFFTVVTHGRRKFLATPDNANLLREALRYTMANHPFAIDAFIHKTGLIQASTGFRKTVAILPIGGVTPRLISERASARNE